MLRVDWPLGARASKALLIALRNGGRAAAVAVMLALCVWLRDPHPLFAMFGVTTDNIKFANTAAITITTSGLAASATVGRQSTVIDNTSNLYVDALVTVTLATNATTPASTKSAYVYVFGSEDGTLFDSDDAQPGASDAAYTVNAASNLKGPVVISMPTASKSYTKTFSVAAMFSGNMPRKWGIVVCNDTANVLATTTTACSYTGVTYTNT